MFRKAPDASGEEVQRFVVLLLTDEPVPEEGLEYQSFVLEMGRKGKIHGLSVVLDAERKAAAQSLYHDAFIKSSPPPLGKPDAVEITTSSDHAIAGSVSEKIRSVRVHAEIG